jgi:hypothetical protein
VSGWLAGALSRTVYSMSALLDEILLLSPPERRVRLGHGDTRAAIVALGTRDGIAWLEEHIQAPIGPEWGRLLYSLNPPWEHLDRWIRFSKPHCLAAIDALLLCIPSPHLGDNNEPKLPIGAEPSLVDDAVTYALDQFGNPRLSAAAKRIRHTWPVGETVRRPICIPEPIKHFGVELFGNDFEIVNDWHEVLATSLNEPKTLHDFWNSLIDFAGCRRFIAIVDWREPTGSIITKLRQLHSANGVPITWQAYADRDGEIEDLFREIESEIKGTDKSLVALCSSGDSYALAFLQRDRIPDLEWLLATALHQTQILQRFE